MPHTLDPRVTIIEGHSVLGTTGEVNSITRNSDFRVARHSPQLHLGEVEIDPKEEKTKRASGGSGPSLQGAGKTLKDKDS